MYEKQSLSLLVYFNVRLTHHGLNSTASYQRSDELEVPMEDREGEAGRSSTELQVGDMCCIKG